MPAEPLLTFGSCRSPGTDLPLTSPGPYCPRTVRFAASSTVIGRIDLNTCTFVRAPNQHRGQSATRWLSMPRVGVSDLRPFNVIDVVPVPDRLKQELPRRKTKMFWTVAFPR